MEHLVAISDLFVQLELRKSESAIMKTSKMVLDP